MQQPTTSSSPFSRLLLLLHSEAAPVPEAGEGCMATNTILSRSYFHFVLIFLHTLCHLSGIRVA